MPRASFWAIRLAWAAPVSHSPLSSRPSRGAARNRALEAVWPGLFQPVVEPPAQRLVEQDDRLDAVGPGLGPAEDQGIDAQPRNLR